jgi:hypothetical protein
MSSRRKPCSLEESAIHVFDIRRSEHEVMTAETPVRWMGERGRAYVWSYQRHGRWYYTRVFDDPRRGVDSPETAVKLRAREGRPWS